MSETASVANKRKFPTLLILIGVFAGAGIIFAVVLILVGGNKNTTNQNSIAVEMQAPSASTGSLINQPAPDFELVNLDGETVRLSDYAGQLVFLNFWATWCIPCRQEMPAFQEFVSTRPGDGPTILAVDVAETPEQVTEFLDELNVRDVPIVIDSDSELQKDYAIQIMPTTYVIDPDGIIRAVKFGEVTLDDLDSYIEAFG